MGHSCCGKVDGYADRHTRPTRTSSMQARRPPPFALCGCALLRSEAARTPSNAPFCVTPGGTRYQDGVTRPLVDRVAELEEKLVNCSMENATAKQDYLTVKLRNSQLEKNTQRLRHELAKSRAMNDLLQNEVRSLNWEGERFVAHVLHALNSSRCIKCDFCPWAMERRFLHGANADGQSLRVLFKVFFFF